MEKVFDEWFWSQASAIAAARRIEKKGYVARVRYAMHADGTHDWLVEAFFLA